MVDSAPDWAVPAAAVCFPFVVPASLLLLVDVLLAIVGVWHTLLR